MSEERELTPFEQTITALIEKQDAKLAPCEQELAAATQENLYLTEVRKALLIVLGYYRYVSSRDTNAPIDGAPST